MMYKVLSVFADLQDSHHLYNAGDEYPRQGYSPSAERLEELSTDKNRLRRPLIEKVSETTTVAKPVVEEPAPVVEQVVEEQDPVVENDEPVVEKTKGRKKKNVGDAD